MPGGGHDRRRGPVALVFPGQLGWHYQQRVWNRRISNKECRMLKGDTGLLPQKDAKASGNPNTLFLVVNGGPILTSQPVSFRIRNSLLDILLFLQRASIANQGRMKSAGETRGWLDSSENHFRHPSPGEFGYVTASNGAACR